MLRAPRGARRLVAALLLLVGLLPGRVHAQNSQWRLFTSDDGLPESWIYEIARGASGRVWTTHGLPVLANFDGYRVRHRPVADRLLAISEGPDSLLWALLTGPDRRICTGVQVLDHTGWTRYPLPELDGQPTARMRLLAWAPGRVLILTPARVLEFNGERRSIRLIADAAAWNAGVFTGLQPAAGGGAWLSATDTLLRLGRPASADVSAPMEVRLPASLREVTWASDLMGTLLVVAHHSGDPSGVLLRHDDAGWTTLATGTSAQPLVAGWAGADRSIWIVRANRSAFTISVIEAGRAEVRLPRSRALSGELNAIEPVPDGSFWLGTSIGLVRHQPRVWQRPPELADHEVHTGSLLEAMSGEIFAVQEDALLRRTDSGWRAYPFPQKQRGNAYYPQTLGSLGDGRIVVGMIQPAPPLVFDPATEGFEPLRHPEGRSMEVLGTRIPAGVWMITRQGPGRPARIESYDGRRFAVRVQADSDWVGDNRPRHILETRSGDLIITPSPTGIALVHGNDVSWLPAPDVPEVRPFVAAELPDGTIWFGGREGLLSFAGARVRPMRAGLQTVRSIITARDGSIWVASNSGVHRYADRDWVTIANNEGLPDGAAFDLLEDHEGQMWVSTSSGLSEHRAGADVDAPETVLVEAENPREAPPSGNLRLVFGGLDRWASTPATRLLYSHRLDDQPWSAFSASTGASLTDVPAGAHRFTVRAMDRNWNIDPTPATMKFTVMLPWYREPGVMALGFATALALAVAAGLFLMHHIRLEREVLERTDALRAELAERRRIESERTGLEAQLRQSQKMEAIGRLAGGISHDFNNLLTVICSYADLIIDSSDGTDQRRDHAREIAKAGARAASLTRQLLSFSRHKAAQPEILDLNAALGDLHRMLARLLGERVDLRFVPGAGLWHVFVDRGQIEQVVLNLAVNARDAMPAGGRVMLETANVVLDEGYVRQRVDASIGPHVRLTITDNGIGMDEHTKARLFEPFFTTKPRGQGSGLGLAIVYGIVHQNGGHIVVASEPGRGSRFEVYLPRAKGESAPSPPAVEERRAVVTGTLLLVEDEDAVRQLAVTALERDGYRVAQAASGEEALAIIERASAPPDLVVTDVVMPGMGGQQLAARLHERWPDLPVLLMSGYTGSEEALAVEPAARTAFLQKPFTPAALTTAVQQMLGTGAG